MKPEYLGDGVYIHYKEDANMFCLTTDTHDHNTAPNVIWLEPQVADALLNYIKKTAEFYTK